MSSRTIAYKKSIPAKLRPAACLISAAIVMYAMAYGAEPSPGKTTLKPSKHYMKLSEGESETKSLDNFLKMREPPSTSSILAQAPVIPARVDVPPRSIKEETISDDPNGITIIELQRLSEFNNPTLKMLRQKLQAAKGEWVQAGVRPNPVLSYEAEEVGDNGKAGKHGFVLEQEITTGGKRQLDQKIGAWACETKRYQWEFQCFAIRNDVKARAYEVLAAQKKVEIRKRLDEIGQKSVEAAGKLGKAGEVSKIDLLQIRAKANESKAALLAAKSEEKVAWKKMAGMVGLPELRQEPILDSLGEIQSNWDRDTFWTLILEQAPQLSVIKAKIRQAQAAQQREQAGAVPDITLNGGVHYDYGERQTLASFGVGMPLRIFDKNRGNIMKARAELAAVCQEQERQVLLLYEEFSETYALWESSKEQAEIYKDKILPDVQQALEWSLKGYRQGEYNYLDVLNAQQIYLESQTQYIDILKDHAIAGVYLEGFLAKGGLDEISE